jgi:hypothetical protein|tara:strand:- start:318 stop:1193 length:876 start_codon:yes stop_codon:yes gene_type:complete
VHKLLLRSLAGVTLGLLLVSVACSGPEPVAVPSFEVDPSLAPIGSPVEATLTFSVLPNASFDEEYAVFLHFLNDDGEVMWATDHYPPIPTTEWKPGETIAYTRPIMVPLCPYVGDANVHIGLYSVDSGTRLPLEGDEGGRLAYRVGGLRLLPPMENIRFSFISGWHLLEHDSTCVQWRWSEKVGVISFDNPRRDSQIYLNLDNGMVLGGEPRTLVVSVGDRPVVRIEVVPGNVVHQIPLGASLLGDTDSVELRLEVDRTIVPAEMPRLDNPDTRVLGVRVLGAYLAVATRE